MNKPHVLVIPYPAQGHVIPLMEFSHELVKHGLKITFVNTDFNHRRIMKAKLAEKGEAETEIQLVSIPDGLEDGEDRNHFGNLTDAMFRVMPKQLEVLIDNINKSGRDNITCVVADQNVGWALEIAGKLGIKRAAFWPASASVLALDFSIPKLLEDRIIDSDGIPIKDQLIQLSPMIPPIRTTHFAWTSIGDLTTQKIIFKLIARNNKHAKDADWIICNSSYDLEPAAFALSPEILPIGPIQATNWDGHLIGNFWQEDSTCLNWLDQQPPQSVIYVAFGSITIFDQNQLQELALGLENSNRPFLWVVRSDINNGENHAFLQKFKARVSHRGKLISWASQQKVLSHPSVACFLSHCGWNSTMDGVTCGVPFLCWPYFADQFYNESYICDFWKVGLRFDKNEDGIITKEEIVCKVNELLQDEKFKTGALEVKEKAINSVKLGGKSYKNFKNFVNWIKA